VVARHRAQPRYAINSSPHRRTPGVIAATGRATTRGRPYETSGVIAFLPHSLPGYGLVLR
jgi:hypothetical protein